MGISLWTATGIDPADFSRFDPVPPEGIARATAIMRSGEMFRYADRRPGDCEVVLLEREMARYVGVRYALAVSSCSKAIQLALAVCGTEAGSKVLVPGFTFSAVPSAILLRGAIPVFVECTEDYRIDLDDLESKIVSDTKLLLLSHMRGYAPDMDAVVALCAKHGIALVEDAAHALGGRRRGKALGSFGKIGCYSFQSNKIVNAGEGGVLVTDDEETIVKAIYLSGAYDSNFRKHNISSALFESFRNKLPLDNARMTNLTAAVARPQIALIDMKGERFRQMHAYLRRELAGIPEIVFPRDHPEELRIPDSIQFRLRNFTPNGMKVFLSHVRDKGIPIIGFGERDNARAFFNWHYLDVPYLPQTERILANSCDLRLSSCLTEEHLSYLASALRGGVLEAQAS